MEEETKKFSWKKFAIPAFGVIFGALIVLALVSGIGQGISALVN